MRIDKKHIKILEKSLISQEVAQKFGVRSLTKEETSEILGYPCPTESLAYPYCREDGSLISYRVAPGKHPDVNAKYLAPKDTELSCFFSPEDLVKFTSKTPILITEGEKKLLSLKTWLTTEKEKELGFKGSPLCISIPGCYGWSGKSDSTGLASVLSKIVYEGREVYFLGDTDFFTNPKVHDGYASLIQALLKKSPESISFIDLRVEGFEGKIGLDDFLVSKNNLGERLKKPFWVLSEKIDIAISDESQVTRLLEQSVLSSSFHTAKVVSYISKTTELTKKQAQTYFFDACKKWKSNKPKTPEETRKLERTVYWDKIQETTEEICAKVGDKISKVSNIYRCPTTNNILSASLKESLEMSEAEHISAHFYDKIFFQKGITNSSGSFKLDATGHTRIDTDIAYTILKNKNYTNLPNLREYSKNPIYTNNTLIYEKGYDHENEVFYAGEEDLKPKSGLYYTNLFLDNFPFKTPSDRTNALALLITSVFFRSTFLRPAGIIQGDGTDLGKSSLAKGIGAITMCGIEPKTLGYNKNDEELEKSFASHVKEENPVIVIDNISEGGESSASVTVSSAVLERSLTDTVMSFRSLGSNQLISKKNIYQIFFSINGGVFSKDLSTRSVLINLTKENLTKISGKPSEGIPTAKKYTKEIIQELLYVMEKWIKNKPTLDGYNVEFPKYCTWSKCLYTVLKSVGQEEHFLKNNDSKKLKFDIISKFLVEVAGLALEYREKTEALSSARWVSLLASHLSFIFPKKISEHSKSVLVSKAMQELEGESLSFIPESGLIINFKLITVYDTHKKTNVYSFQRINPIPPSPPEPKKLEQEGGASNNHEEIITLEPSPSWYEPQKEDETYSYSFADKTYASSWWNGETLEKEFCFDLETEADKPKNIILVSAFDGKRIYRILPTQLHEFLELHKNHTFICHNSEFDINHLLAFCDRMDLALPFLKNRQIKDTLALSKLISLAEGRIGGNDLGAVTQRYLGGLHLPKDVEVLVPGEKKPKKVSLSYGHYPNIKLAPRCFLHYNAFDVLAPFFLWEKLKTRAQEICDEHGTDRKKLLSYDLLISTGICGGITSHYGFKVDEVEVLKKKVDLEEKLEALLVELRKYGYDPEAKKKEKRTKGFVGIQDIFSKIMRKLEEDLSICFVKTYHKGRKKEVYSAKIDDLKEFSHIPFVKNYLEYESLSDTLVKYVEPLLYTDRIHSTYKAGKTSGRISSTNPNLQNIPRTGGIRELYVSGPKKKLIIADYSSAELQCAGQYSLDHYGHSHFAEMLNSGKDVHRYVAAKYLGKPESEVTKEDRAAGKPFNFGRFAGSGAKTLQATAKNDYGVDLTLDQTKEIISVWDNLFPEVKDHFNAANKALESSLGVSKWDMYPLLKTAKGDVEDISEEKQNEAWEHMTKLRGKFPGLAKFHDDISNCIPSEELERALQSTRVSITKRSGRIRGGCNYSTWCNNSALQSPQADITNTAWRKLLEEGLKIVNVVHDEFIVECDEEKAEETQKRVTQIMLETAKEFNPDMTNMAVESVITNKWEKV